MFLFSRWERLLKKKDELHKEERRKIDEIRLKYVDELKKLYKDRIEELKWLYDDRIKFYQDQIKRLEEHLASTEKLYEDSRQISKERADLIGKMLRKRS